MAQRDVARGDGLSVPLAVLLNIYSRWADFSYTFLSRNGLLICELPDDWKIV